MPNHNLWANLQIYTFSVLVIYSIIWISIVCSLPWLLPSGNLKHEIWASSLHKFASVNEFLKCESSSDSKIGSA